MWFKELYSVYISVNIATLEKLESTIYKETSKKSSHLLSSIKYNKFVVPLIMINKKFSFTLTLYTQLQTVNFDLVEASRRWCLCSIR